MRRGFTLIEMLVVIGIIAALVAASLGGYSVVTRSAETTKCRELVAQVSTALMTLYQREGNWPKILVRNGQGATDGKLDKDAAIALQDYYSLNVDNDGKLAGYDRFGVVTPWALTVIKTGGKSVSTETKVSGNRTIDDHILHYALDLDGDGIIQNASVGGQKIDVRATAIVWCGGKDGVIDPYPYTGGGEGGKGSASGSGNRRSDDVYSWAPGQTRNVK